MKEPPGPSTEAGRALADAISDIRVALAQEVVAIEAEARAAALQAVEEAVNALRLRGKTGHPEDEAYDRALAAVLTAIHALQEPTPNEQ